MVFTAIATRAQLRADTETGDHAIMDLESFESFDQEIWKFLEELEAQLDKSDWQINEWDVDDDLVEERNPVRVIFYFSWSCVMEFSDRIFLEVNEVMVTVNNCFTVHLLHKLLGKLLTLLSKKSLLVIN